MAVEIKMRPMKCRKENFPKVGEKFYWERDGELHEAVCKHIADDGKTETRYFTSWDEHGGTFINAGDVLDPCSTRVHELKFQKEKQEWREFWTDKRIQEIAKASTVLNTYEDWKDYVESKF